MTGAGAPRDKAVYGKNRRMLNGRAPIGVISVALYGISLVQKSQTSP